MIELGGNITLAGFTGRDYAELIIVKKIVGRYARQLSDAQHGFERLLITLKQALPGDFQLEASCTINGTSFSATGSAQNLFVALDSTLKELRKAVEQ